jgi:hypothetical protein
MTMKGYRPKYLEGKSRVLFKNIRSSLYPVRISSWLLLVSHSKLIYFPYGLTSLFCQILSVSKIPQRPINVVGLDLKPTGI